MKCRDIMLKVKLPDNFLVSQVDEALADTLTKLDGEVLESNHFVVLCD